MVVMIETDKPADVMADAKRILLRDACMTAAMLRPPPSASPSAAWPAARAELCTVRATGIPLLRRQWRRR